MAKRRGRPMNLELHKEFLKTINEFAYRNFGVKAKVLDIGSANLVRLQNVMVDKYMPKYGTRSNGERYKIKKGGNKRLAIRRMEAGGVYDRAMAEKGRWNKTGEINVEKLVKDMFGEKILNNKKNQIKRLSAFDGGKILSLQDWGLQRTLKNILQNNSDVYEASTEDEKQIFRDLNDARQEKAPDIVIDELSQKAIDLHKKKMKEFNDSLLKMVE